MQCRECGRKFSALEVVCEKFPNGIPEEILYDQEVCKHLVTEWRDDGSKGKNKGVPQKA